MDEIKVDMQLFVAQLEAQRNQAYTENAMLAAKLTQVLAENAVLKKQIEKCPDNTSHST